MKNCILCNNEIKDYGYLLTKGFKAPKYCETCRRKIRNYRSTNEVERELVDAWLVKLDNSFLENLCHDGKNYYLGGPTFGPKGGVVFKQKYLVFFPHGGGPEVRKTYVMRLMKKTYQDKEWLYLAFDETDEESVFELKLKFTRVYKTTLQGYGRQYDHSFPIEEEHEVVLEGWSHCRSGRFGNEWALYLNKIK